MATNFPNGVSSQGVPLMPGVPLSTGTYFFVHSGVGADSQSGRDKQHPLATIQAAINKCTANRGDVVLVMPGHAEAVTTTSHNLSVAGVSVVGLGTGLLRPTLTYGAAASTFTVSAASCSVTNLHVIGNFDNVAAAFTVGAAKDFKLTFCSFIDVSASLHFLSIVVTGSTANAADGLTVTDCDWQGLALAPNAFISILGACARARIQRNFVDMLATNDVGHFLTVAALVVTQILVSDNILMVTGATNAAVAVFMTGSSTTNSGAVVRNFVTSLDTSAAIFITATLALAVHQNYQSGVIAGSGTLAPDADDPEG